MTDQEYVAWLETFESWYGNRVSQWHFFLMACRTLSVMSSILAAVLAAFMTDKTFALARVWVVGASLVGAISGILLAEFRVVKMEALREAGRAEAQHLVIYARDKLEEFKDDPTKRFAIKDEIRERLRNLEVTQGREFAQVHQPDGMPRTRRPRSS